MPPTRKRKPPEARLDAVRRHLLGIGDPELACESPAETIGRLAQEVEAPGSSIAWLAAYDATRSVREAAGMALFLIARDPSVSARLRRGIGRGAAPWLLSALRDPEVPDERKYPLGPLLLLYGVSVPEEAYRACFHDLDLVRATKAREAMRQILDRPDHLERVLEGVLEGLADDSGEGVEAALEVSACVCEQNPSVGALLAGALTAIACEAGLGRLEAIDHALEAAAATRCGRAAWVMGELGRWPGLAEVGERARDLAAALNDAAVIAQGPRPGAFSHGFVGPIDGAGSQAMTLFFRTGEGTLHALLMRLSDRDGVEAVACIYHEGAALDEATLQDGTLAPCDLELARALLGDALATHEDLDRPPPGRLFLHRPFFGVEPLCPDHRDPRLGDYMPETVVPSTDLVEGSEELVDCPVYGGLWTRSDSAYALVARRWGAPRPRRSRRATAERRALAAALLELMTERERSALVRRMAVNLELEARAGRARRPSNRLAARTWLALSERIVPFERTPYVLALCERAVAEITRDLESGWSSWSDARLARLSG